MLKSAYPHVLSQKLLNDFRLNLVLWVYINNYQAIISFIRIFIIQLVLDMKFKPNL